MQGKLLLDILEVLCLHVKGVWVSQVKSIGSADGAQASVL